MDRLMIEAWNDTVPLNATVWHLGDVVLARGKQDPSSVLGRLHGRIHYLCGNHDRLATLQELAQHQEHVPYYAEVKHEKQRMILCHYSMRSWNKMHRGSWHLFGHSHGNLDHVPFGKSMDVGVDAVARLGLGYRPISFEEIKSIMDKRDIETLDHHNPNSPR